jgi:hypothetical protein
LSDFGDGAVFKLGEDEWGSEVFREGLDGEADSGGAFVLEGGVVRWEEGIGENVGRIWALVVGIGAEVEGLVGVALAVAEAVLGEVGGDGIEPREKTAGGIEALAMPVDPDERFLGEILSVGRAGEDACEVADEALGVMVHELIQGRIIAIEETPEAVLVLRGIRLGRGSDRCCRAGFQWAWWPDGVWSWAMGSGASTVWCSTQ